MKDFLKECIINLKELWDKPLNDLPNWVYWEWCIYKITNLVNNKCYIGQAKSFYTRLVGGSSTQWSHLNGFKNHLENGSRIRLYGAINKYGSENFIVQIIDESGNYNQDELDNLEIKYIKEFNSIDPTKGYNMNPGGISGGIEYMSSPECRRIAVPKIIEINTLNGNGDCMYMCHTEEARLKSIETRKKLYNGDPMGPLHTPEVITKASHNSSITQCINNINARFKSLIDSNLDITPKNYYYFTGDEDHQLRSNQHHIEAVCNHMYDDNPIQNDPRWTPIMSELFQWFDNQDNWNNLIHDSI